jgi:hypothetical protein
MECILRPAFLDLSGPLEGFAVSFYLSALGPDAEIARRRWELEWMTPWPCCAVRSLKQLAAPLQSMQRMVIPCVSATWGRSVGPSPSMSGE